jgi:uncharacterized protein YqgV (UPF0045/DUF77 family)
MITAEVAVYPLKTNDATGVINRSINALQGNPVDYSVNSLNTVVKGTKDDVFKSLLKMFSEAENSGGEISMVITLSNAT